MKSWKCLLSAGASPVVVLHLLAPPSLLPAPARTRDGAVQAVGLRSEYATNPLGIDVRKPRLSWQLQSTARGLVQSAYQVRVAGRERSLRGGQDLSLIHI